MDKTNYSSLNDTYIFIPLGWGPLSLFTPHFRVALSDSIDKARAMVLLLLFCVVQKPQCKVLLIKSTKVLSPWQNVITRFKFPFFPVSLWQKKKSKNFRATLVEIVFLILPLLYHKSVCILGQFTCLLVWYKIFRDVTVLGTQKEVPF